MYCAYIYIIKYYAATKKKVLERFLQDAKWESQDGEICLYYVSQW